MRENPVFSRVLMDFIQGKSVEKIRGKIVGPKIHCSPDLTRGTAKKDLYSDYTVFIIEANIL